MTNIVGSMSETDQTGMSDPPANFIPWDQVDRALFEVVHPEKAMDVLGMSSRTAHRKIKSGEFLYTTERGAKRILIERQPTVTDKGSDTRQTVSKMTDPASDMGMDREGDLSEKILALSEKILEMSEILSEKDRLIQEKDQLIMKKDSMSETLNNQLMAANTALQKRNLPEPVDPRQKEIEELKEMLAQQAKLIESISASKKPWWKFW